MVSKEITEELTKTKAEVLSKFEYLDRHVQTFYQVFPGLLDSVEKLKKAMRPSQI